MGIITNQHTFQHDDYIVLVSDQKMYQPHNEAWSPVRYSSMETRFLCDELCLFMGLYNGQHCYVVESTSVSEVDTVSLRSQMPLLTDADYQLASRALQLVTWYKRHRFCGQCGRPTVFDAEENALACRPCQLTYYPRVSPCMMCLIVRGDECLLAHHNRHPEGLYSTLAGFVEAGENVEQTIHREVFEEVGLKVNHVSYYSSQSWPFPHQLMIGYFAEYQSGDITVDHDEILDARWFHYTDLPKTPAPETLSGQLISQFVAQCESRVC